MNVSDAILEFSRKQPEWVQDAMRRLATKNDLSERDIAEIMAMLKAQHGISSDGDFPSANPLSESHLKPTSGENGRVALLEISNIERVNRLAEGQRLRFSPKGITLIYGDNGSGKSGYCRLLKKLCRVREGAEEEILPDAFQPRPGHPAQATVRFLDELGNQREELWVDGHDPPAVLRHISVFDSETIPLYVDKDGRVDYLPYGLDLLPRLGQLLQRLAGDLRTERATVEARCQAPLPHVPQETEVGQLLARLSTTAAETCLPTEEDILRVAEFATSDAERLRTIGGLLGDNTRELATLVEKALVAVRTIQGLLPRLLEKFCDDAIDELQRQVRRAREAREAATLAASEAFSDEPLPGVGSEPWRRMFEYARDYSKIAYPGESFPVTRPGSRCVLCQQELGDTAKDRLQRFQAFIQRKAETDAAKAGEALRKSRQELEALTVPDPDAATRDLAGFDGGDDELRSRAKAFLEVLAARKKLATAHLTGETERLDVPPLPVDPTPRLGAMSKRLTARLEEMKAVQGSAEARKLLEEERRELQARRMLADNLEIVRERRKDLQLLHRLKACIKACDTTALSRKSTELRRTFITDSFKKRLQEEIKFFDIGYLPLGVVDRSERGESFVGVALDSDWDAPIREVLSEGERKAVALAVFFAEIGGLPGGNGLIFDDPVSSLDHSRRRLVARRLVTAAGSGRQVVVFTHDLVFFQELQVAAAEATPPVPVVTHEIHRTEEAGFGTIKEGSEPWFVAKARSRLPELERKLSALRTAAKVGGEEHRTAAASFYTALRDTWESLVESELLNGVVTRFTKDVKTQSLNGVVVDDEDYKRVYYSMKRASEWSGHSPPPAGQVALPSPEEAKQHLDDLKDYLATLKERRREVEKRREALKKPPVGELR